MELIPENINIKVSQKRYSQATGRSVEHGVSVTYRIPEGMVNGVLKEKMVAAREKLEIQVLLGLYLGNHIGSNTYSAEKEELKKTYAPILERLRNG